MQLNDCFRMAHAMKLNPQDLRFAAKVDLESLLKAENRPQFRRVIGQQLSGRRLLTPQMVVLIAAALDVIGTLLTAGLLALRYPGETARNDWLVYGLFAGFGGMVLVAMLQGLGLYQFPNLLSPFRRLAKLVFSWFLTFVILAVGIFMLKYGDYVSRAWFTSWALSGVFFFVSWRFMLGGFLRHSNRDGHFNKRAVLVGGGENAARVISVLDNSTETGINLIGVFDDRDDVRVPGEVKGLFKLGGIDDLIDFVRSTPIDALIVTLPTTAEERLVQILDRLWVLPVDIRLSAQGQKLRLRPRAYSYIGNLPCLDVYDKPLGEWGPFLKTILDKSVAAMMMLLLAPVYAAIALAIKLDSKGPVFFKQKRYGFNNELIEIYKFRSMYAEQSDAHASKLVSRGDARVTRVGKFIRRTTLDEIPQFLNVLKGELSLVGPRPHATQAKAGAALYEHVVDGYFARHRVKPGLTGWAQINGWRGETDTTEKIERRVEHDLFYIENWSLTFDLYILARTPIALFTTQNAY
jgi:Undecaprenyl-phosphate glucose phosphotransferase